MRVLGLARSVHKVPTLISLYCRPKVEFMYVSKKERAGETYIWACGLLFALRPLMVKRKKSNDVEVDVCKEQQLPLSCAEEKVCVHSPRSATEISPKQTPKRQTGPRHSTQITVMHNALLYAHMHAETHLAKSECAVRVAHPCCT